MQFIYVSQARSYGVAWSGNWSAIRNAETIAQFKKELKSHLLS